MFVSGVYSGKVGSFRGSIWMLSVIDTAWFSRQEQGPIQDLRQLRAPVLIVQQEKDQQDQELGDVPGYREPIPDLRGILDGNFGDMPIHIGTKHKKQEDGEIES